MAVPHGTTIFVDGVRQTGNPISLTVPQDKEWHLVEARAPGFVTRTHRVRFEADVTLDIKLEQTQ